MSAQPAYEPSRRSAARPAPSRRGQTAPGAAPRRGDDRLAAAQRRRRQQRFRQRRRDLTLDAVIGFVLAITALIVASGLGVIAIASIPVLLALVGTVVLERRARKRSNSRRARPSRRL